MQLNNQLCFYQIHFGRWNHLSQCHFQTFHSQFWSSSLCTTPLDCAHSYWVWSFSWICEFQCQSFQGRTSCWRYDPYWAWCILLQLQDLWKLSSLSVIFLGHYGMIPWDTVFVNIGLLRQMKSQSCTFSSRLNLVCRPQTLSPKIFIFFPFLSIGMVMVR